MKTLTSGLVLLGFGVAGCTMEPHESAGDVGELESSLRADRLHYEEVDITTPPAPYDFWGPAGLSNRGAVLGNGFDCDDESGVCATDLLEFDRNGEFNVLLEDFGVNEVNGPGDAGGCVIDPETQFGQAAIRRANGRLLLIPRLPGEISSCVVQLSDSEVAVVSSTSEAFEDTLYVLRNRQTTPFSVPDAALQDINDHGEIAGIITTPSGDRAFRFDSRTQTTTILGPVPPDPDSWGMAINKQGEVLGYSFEFNAVERIGKWNRRNRFEVHFVEGTPEFPTISNRLIWNERGVIVVSLTTDENTYIIPEPGVRLNLSDLVDDGVVPPALFAVDINEQADFVATSLSDGTSTLFRRSCD